MNQENQAPNYPELNPPESQEVKFAGLQRKGTIRMIGQYNPDIHAQRSINFRQAELNYMQQSQLQPQGMPPGMPPQPPVDAADAFNANAADNANTNAANNNLPTGVTGANGGMTAEQVQRLEERRTRERQEALEREQNPLRHGMFGSTDPLQQQAQITQAKTNARSELCNSMILFVIFAILMGVNTDEREQFSARNSTQLLWM